MNVTIYLCKIKKGKFKGIEGYTFEIPLFPHSLKVSIFDSDGNEYWVDTDSVEFIGREEIELEEGDSE